MSDVLSGKSKVPFATKSSWLKVQQACPDLSRVHKYLTTGAAIPKKKKKLTDVKRYISCGTTVLTGNHDGLLVIKQLTPFKPVTTRVVIPREVSNGLLTALHIQLNHPSANQLKLVFSREFFCLDMDALARKVTDQCYMCTSLKTIPSTFHQQSSSVPGNIIGCKYAADVVRRSSQFILIAREDITSYTEGVLINDEKADTLCKGLLLLMTRFRSPQGPRAVIRTDPASGLRSLLNNKMLEKYNLGIELGEPKNINKNPVAESSVRELHSELLRLQPLGGKISETTLAQAICSMNSKIRHHKLSAAEAWTKCDMSTGVQLKVDDKELINLKYAQRCNNHEASAKHKSRGKSKSPFPDVLVGQLVFLYSDSSKLKSRDKYIILAVDNESVWVQKFTSNQFRNRQYKVKRSDLIIIQSDEEYKPPSDGKSKTINKKPLTKSPSNQIMKSHKRANRTDHKTLFSDSSDEDSDDDYSSVNALRFFLPNTVCREVNLLNEADYDEEPHDEQDSDIENNDSLNDVAERRPIRNTRQPAYLNDYITELSTLFDTDQSDVEQDDTLVVTEDADAEDDDPAPIPPPINNNVFTENDNIPTRKMQLHKPLEDQVSINRPTTRSQTSMKEPVEGKL